jgi:hypothetical protein
LAADRHAVRERYLAARAGLPAPDVCALAREVVVVGSSSRGGSSIFAEVLRRVPGLLHLRAEMNPQLRLCGVDGGPSDVIAADTPIPTGLSTLLGADCGRPAPTLDARDLPAFSAEICARLVLQWPGLPIDRAAVEGDVAATLTALHARGWPVGTWVGAAEFYPPLFRRLCARWPALRPAVYDLDRARVAGLGPAGDFLPDTLVEEPPFVLPVPWAHPTAAELGRLPLVIKTPSNAYRLGWLARLFPNARLRLLHLTRNPAASINGLVDGWRYPGFHSHDVGGLQISGYTGEVPGGDRWWKFDRPPGWEAYRGAPLPEVCAFQWASAHRALLDFNPVDRFSLRFEDVLGPPARQEPALRALAAWLDLPDPDALVAAFGPGLPSVMATAQPRHRRWFNRIGTLEPVCARPLVAETRAALGYPADPEAWE